MQLISKSELNNITGGLTINGTLISSLVKGISTILDLGRTLGTAINRVLNNNYC